MTGSPAASAERRLELLPVACGAFAALGIRDASLGVAWPSVRSSFGQPLAALGIVLVAGTAGALVASLASGRLLTSFGPKRVLVGLALLGALGVGVATVAPVWVGFVVGMGVVGLSAGGADAGLNTVVALGHGVRGLGLLHAAFGAGAIVGPVVMAVVIAGPGSWRLGYVVLFVLYLAVAGGFVVARLPTAAAAPGAGEAAAPPGPSRHRAALACALALFFVYVGVESCAGQWSYSLFTESRGMGTLAAGVWVGAFWAAFTGGRVLTGLLGHRWPAVALLDASVVVATAGAALVWWSPVPAIGGLGLAVLGLGLAAVYPTLVALTPRRLGARRAPQAIGYQVAAAGLGFAVLPALFGVLAEDVGLEALGPVLLGGIAVLVALHRLAVRLEPDAAVPVQGPGERAA